MPTYSKQFLSTSTDLPGKAVNITATGTSTMLIHQTEANPNIIDEVWLYASNPTASDVMLNILYGGQNFTTDILFEGVIEAYAGNVLVCPGLIARGNESTSFPIWGNVSVPSGVNIFGYVNRIS